MFVRLIWSHIIHILQREIKLDKYIKDKLCTRMVTIYHIVDAHSIAVC